MTSTLVHGKTQDPLEYQNQRLPSSRIMPSNHDHLGLEKIMSRHIERKQRMEEKENMQQAPSPTGS